MNSMAGEGGGRIFSQSVSKSVSQSSIRQPESGGGGVRRT